MSPFKDGKVAVQEVLANVVEGTQEIVEALHGMDIHSADALAIVVVHHSTMGAVADGGVKVTGFGR